MADPKTDERLVGGNWAAPQGRPTGIDGTSRAGPLTYMTDSFYAAGTGLARRIRGFRGLYDMDRSRLAAALKVPETTIAAWEAATESPTVLQLCLLCDVFRTTPNALLMGPFYVQDGPLRGLGHHLETLPGEVQMAMLFMARVACQANNMAPPTIY